MSQSKTYKLSVGKSSDLVTLTSQQIVEQCDKSIAELTKLINHNDGIIAFLTTAPTKDSSHSYTYWGCWLHNKAPHIVDKVISARAVWPNYSRAESVNTEAVVAENNKLNKLIGYCQTFKKKVLDNKRFAKTDGYVVITSDNRYGTDCFVLNGVAPASVVKCSICGSRISIEHIARHKETIKCQSVTKRQNLRKQGYKIIEPRNRALYNLIKSGVIYGAELIPYEYEMWVPGWVASASDSFKKAGSQYAGMTLEEFIERMSPDKTITP